jgi:hypothetical protein
LSYITKYRDDDGQVVYEVGVSVQDGTDRSTFTGPDAEKEAFECYRLGVKWSRGFPGMDDPDPEGKSIPLPRVRDMTTWPDVTVQTNGRFDWDERLWSHAAQVALDNSPPLKRGERYQVQVRLVKIEDTFIGEGI